MKLFALWIFLVFIGGCARHYTVQITNIGNDNKVSIDVTADVPKTISTDAILDAGPL